ncbi:helix-turn-helix transcriptional regulator [Streptomyces globisporus]|uniref:helix-turn-helix transcriptional regulator n=1 Tax=Streptomyces globisporus TaxID=1908 RepID=UPI0036D82DA1
MRNLRVRVPQQEGADPEREMSYDIAQQVFEVRTALGLTQGELAERSGTKQPAVSGVESAKKLPTLGLLLRIAAALDRRLVIRFERIRDSE